MMQMTQSPPSSVENRNDENRNALIFGFTPQAEIWNGRLAMVGFAAIILTELFSKEGIMHFWGLL